MMVLDIKRVGGAPLPREHTTKTGRPKAAGGFVWLWEPDTQICETLVR